MARLNLKKMALSGFVLVSFALYSVAMRQTDNVRTTVAPKPTQSSSNSSSVPPSTSPRGQASSNTQTANPTYKDGQYVGPVTDALYGDLQVRVTISGGKIAAVSFLQYPNDRPESTSINEQAIPFLQQEAIRAQSARVDSVSGATDTSVAFRESLSAALAKAM